jgi:hypothetical protein
LHRSPTVIHASVLMGVAVLVAGLGGGGFSVAGVLFLALYFAPVYVAYRRDRLSISLLFATIFLPTWPWAAWKAFERRGPAAPVSPQPTGSGVVASPSHPVRSRRSHRG